MSDSDSNEESDWEEVREEDYILPKLEEENHEDDGLTAKEYTQQLDIPTGGIEITIEKDGETQRKKKGFDLAGYIRRQVNRRKRELQEDIHKTHVLCLFSRGRSINRILKSEEILAVSLSLLPSKQAYPPKNVDLSYLENFIKWFRKAFKVEQESVNSSRDSKSIYSLTEIQSNLGSMMVSKTVVNQDYLVFIFVAILRALGVHVRLVMSLQPVPLKPASSDLMQNSSSNQKKGGGRKKSSDNNNEEDLDDDNDEGPSCSKKLSKNNNSSTKNAVKKKDTSRSTTKKAQATQADSSKRAKSEAKSNVTESTAKPRRGRKAKSVPTKGLKQEEDDDEEMEGAQFDNSYQPSDFSDSDSDFDLNRSRSSNRKRKKKIETAAAPTPKSKKSKKEVGRGRKMLSSDEDEKDIVSAGSQLDKSLSKKNERKRQFVDVWAEVYLEEEERWVSVDLQSEKIMCDAEFEAKATPPLIYVIAYGNDERVKDVTRRYASRWLTGTQKLRADSSWWQDTLKPFIGKRTRRDKEEDKLLDQQLLNQPIPSSVQEIKGHPLFAMRRHLLKFEDIYPPDPPPLGFIKNEPVYSRDVVHTLHSRELWIKQAKVVRVGEKPYKIVKARPKYDRVTSTVIKDRPLELYGDWQVEDYIPPPAVDGKVPRNEYGNVELFKPTMLPKGTVHLKDTAGLCRIAKKLGIDCAPALVGFEFHSGGSHPTYDGFVVCEEFKDVLLDAWREDQIQVQKREEERRRKRVRGNWRRLIRMVIVRRRLERKYGSFNLGSTGDSTGSKSNNNGPSSSKTLKKKQRRPSAESPPPSSTSPPPSVSTNKKARKTSSRRETTTAEEKPKKRQQPARRGRKK